MDISLSAEIIAILSIINTIFIVVALIKIIKTIGETQKLIELARMHITPIAHDVTQITGDIRSVVKSIEKQVDNIDDGVAHVRDTARNIKEFELMVQHRIEEPLLEVTSVLSAIIKGSRVFWRSFSRK